MSPFDFSTDEIPIDAEVLAQLIRIVPDYKPGTKIRLLVCWAGYYTDGLSADLSRLLNVEVLAASNRVSVLDGVVHLWKHRWLQVPSAWYGYFSDGSRKLRD